VKLDGVLSSVDSDCDMPDDQNILDIAQANGGIGQINGLISDLIIKTNHTGETPSIDHSLTHTVILANSTVYTVYVVAKRFGSQGRHLKIELDLTSETWAEFDLDGAVEDSLNCDTQCIDLGDDSYLLALSFETEGIDAGEHSLVVSLLDSAGNANFIGDATSGVYLSDISLHAGEMMTVAASHVGTDLTVTASDYELTDSDMIRKLSANSAEVIIEFTVNAENAQGFDIPIFTVFEDELNYLCVSMGVAVE